MHAFPDVENGLSLHIGKMKECILSADPYADKARFPLAELTARDG